MDVSTLTTQNKTLRNILGAAWYGEIGLITKEIKTFFNHEYLAAIQLPQRENSQKTPEHKIC